MHYTRAPRFQEWMLNSNYRDVPFQNDFYWLNLINRRHFEKVPLQLDIQEIQSFISDRFETLKLLVDFEWMLTIIFEKVFFKKTFSKRFLRSPEAPFRNDWEPWGSWDEEWLRRIFDQQRPNEKASADGFSGALRLPFVMIGSLGAPAAEYRSAPLIFFKKSAVRQICPVPSPNT